MLCSVLVPPRGLDLGGAIVAIAGSGRILIRRDHCLRYIISFRHLDDLFERRNKALTFCQPTTQVVFYFIPRGYTVTKRWYTPETYEQMNILLRHENWAPMRAMNCEGATNYLIEKITESLDIVCLLYTSPSPRDKRQSRMPSSA